MDAAADLPRELTILMPCLDEAATDAACIAKARCGRWGGGAP